MSRKALVLLVCCCDFRDGAERLIPSKSLGNAVIRAFPGLFRILRMCAPRRAAAVVRPRERKKSADRRRRILISRLLIIRASVPRRKSPFPAYFKGFPAVSPLIPPYPAFLKYPVSPQQNKKCAFPAPLRGNRNAARKLHALAFVHFVVHCLYTKFHAVSCHLPENPSKRDTVHSIAHRIPFVSNFIGSYRYRSSFCQRASPFCFSSVRKARRPSLCSSRRS